MILNILLLRSFHQAEGNPFDGLKDTGKKARPGNGPTRKRREHATRQPMVMFSQ